MVDAGNNKYLIKTKNYHIQLIEVLKNWAKKNATLSENMYKNFIQIRSGLGLPVLSEGMSSIEINSADSIKNNFFENSNSDGDHTIINFLEKNSALLQDQSLISLTSNSEDYLFTTDSKGD